MSWPPRYTPPRAWHCCSAACCPALERVQVPAAYVPPADVQIPSPPAEQAARESKAASARGTGLTGDIRAAAALRARWRIREILPHRFDSSDSRRFLFSSRLEARFGALRAGRSLTAGVTCYTPKGTPCATSGSDSCSFYLAARATRRRRQSLTDGRLRAASRSTPVVMEARSHPSPSLAEAAHQVVPVPPEAVALADRFELVLGVSRRDGCGGHATDHARHRACAEYCRPRPCQRSDDSAP